MAFDAAPASPQYDRDLRSAHIGFKRSKDSAIKWSHGARPLHNTPDGTKMRPARTFTVPSYMHRQPNIVKARNTFFMPAGRLRDHADAYLEISDAKHLTHADMAGSFHKAESDDAESFAAGPASVLYSFDNTDSPPPALTLDAFVKPNVRATEKLVEKEYEVLDDNGDAVKGRKARQMLRKAAAAAGSPAAAAPAKAPAIEILDEDDFELV